MIIRVINHSWTFGTLLIIVSALFIVVIVWLIAWKSNCQLTQIIGKRLANLHDLEKVNVKQTPSHGEDIEMSALMEDRSVSYTSEGQQSSFRRTDANAAWTQCQK